MPGLAAIDTAFVDLLQVTVASAPAIRRQLPDLAYPGLEPAATRGRARSPGLPIAEGAIDGQGDVVLATRGLVDDACASLASVRGLLLHPAEAHPLVACGTTDGRRPLLPLTQHAIDRADALLLASPRLNQGPRARCAPTFGRRPDVAFPLAQLVAAALFPLLPLAELARQRLALGFASFHRAVDNIHLVAVAGAILAGREEVAGAAVLLRQAELPLTHPRRKAAARAALVHLMPRRPSAEELLLAIALALAGLLRRPGIARLAAMVGHRLDESVPEPLGAALGAIPPVGPQAPLAIRAVALVARLSVARRGLLEGVIARRAVVRRRAQDVALAGLLAASAALGAFGPVLPSAYLA
mmetsp:Transcript_67683/g.220331  ORF Transcript_67683/g.220331 Transcript_67683/m.220331 type:complete len:356 (+) Transcript_67683:2603-3670(+)